TAASTPKKRETKREKSKRMRAVGKTNAGRRATTAAAAAPARPRFDLYFGYGRDGNPIQCPLDDLTSAEAHELLKILEVRPIPGKKCDRIEKIRAELVANPRLHRLCLDGHAPNVSASLGKADREGRWLTITNDEQDPTVECIPARSSRSFKVNYPVASRPLNLNLEYWELAADCVPDLNIKRDWPMLARILHSI
ncbi:hypothetical protein PMAYCL1PPCAC_13866, partial [Pristionchus mayeri]